MFKVGDMCIYGGKKNAITGEVVRIVEEASSRHYYIELVNPPNASWKGFSWVCTDRFLTPIRNQTPDWVI